MELLLELEGVRLATADDDGRYFRGRRAARRHDMGLEHGIAIARELEVRLAGLHDVSLREEDGINFGVRQVRRKNLPAENGVAQGGKNSGD